MADRGLCLIPDCNKPAWARRRCSKHYDQWWRENRAPLLPHRICIIPDCGKMVSSRQWCDLHYRRWLRNGDPINCLRAPTGELERYYREVVTMYDGDDCLIWPYSRSRGYAMMTMDGKNLGVCRFLCAETYGPPLTADHQAAHSCGKGKQGCVTKRHLSWKLSVDNHADRIAHGTHLRGNTNPSARLTEDEVHQIRALRGHKSRRELAAKFGVSMATIKAVHNRHNWGWLPD